MKKYFTYSIFFFFISMMASPVIAQVDGSLLLGLINVTTTEMNNVSNPIKGSLLYNTTNSAVYQYNGSIWVELTTSSPVRVLPKTTNYTLASGDNGNIITFDNNSDVTLTFPSGLPIGFNISIYQIGTGKIILTGASGVTLKNRLSRYKTAGKDAGAGIISTELNIFHVAGDLKK